MDANQGLKDIEMIKAVRTSDVVENYRRRDDAIRHAKSIDFVIHLELVREEKNSREKRPTHMRSNSRILRNEFNNAHNSRFGMADTRDHTRRMPQLDGYYGRNRRNDSPGTFPRRNRHNQYREFNWAVGDDVDGEDDNGNYYGGSRVIRSTNGAFAKSGLLGRKQ